MKLLHVETGRHLYGGARQVMSLLGGLRDEGVANVLVCPRQSAIADAGISLAEKLYALPMRGDADLLFVWRLRRVILEERPDIVHLHSRRGADTLGGIAARWAGVRTVLSRRVDNHEAHWSIRLRYRLYDKVIAISEAIRTELADSGVPANKLIRVYSAVSPNDVAHACARDLFYCRFERARDRNVVGMVAQFIPRKGHRYLLQAIPHIVARVPNTVFVFFGQGPLEGQIHQLARRLGVANDVIFAGFREDLPRLMPCLDILVHPAEKEGLGVAVMQAAAAGVPVVATAVGGIPEVVRDGVTGCLVPPRDPFAIAQAIVRLLGNPALASRLGRQGKRRIAQKFSVPAMVTETLAVYRSVVQLTT